MTQLALGTFRELVVDSFAGGGGASTGIERALGRAVDIAINHDPEAIAMHAANHPMTRHYVEDVWRVDPEEVTGGRPVGLLWLSPDCKHFSKAKGGKPVSKKVRGLAWLAVYWAKKKRPRLICLENVEEFQDWGPVLPDGRPCPLRRGLTFRRFVRELEKLGYKVEHRQLRACDYGAPTTRKRLFLIARCDGKPIVWPKPTHGQGLKPYRTAAEIIDWTIPVPSIFDRDKPLADATLRRIARGVDKYVLKAAEPFIVTLRGTEPSHVNASARSTKEPLRTISAAGTHHALVVPTLITRGWGERKGQKPRVPGLEKPLGTIPAQGEKHALVCAFLAKHNAGPHGGATGQDLRKTLGTITTKDHHSLVYAFLLKYYGTDQDPRLKEPLHTITTKDRFALVTVRGEQYELADIGMRMLTKRELARGQGFPEHYVLDPWVGAGRLSSTAQGRMIGNSVCPDLAAAIVRANYGTAERRRLAA